MIDVGATTRAAAALTGVARATAAGADMAAGVRCSPPRSEPANRLTAAEPARLLATLNIAVFVDRTPVQVYAVLLARVCICVRCRACIGCWALTLRSSTGAGWLVIRRVRPELITTGPGQVFTCDIAKLRGPVTGSYYDAYVMIDIYSRYIVGACVHVTETAVLAEEMMREVFTVHGTPRVTHADRGTSMTSKIVAALLTISA